MNDIKKETKPSQIKCLSVGEIYKELLTLNSLSFDELGRKLVWIRKPEFKQFASNVGDPVIQDDVNSIYQYFDEKHIGKSVTLKNVELALDRLKSNKRHNPISEHIKSLPAWDREPRLNTLAIDVCGSNPDPRFHDIYGTFIRKFFMQIVNRALNPGCKADYTLILQGPQGARKSTFARIIGDKFFSDQNIDPDNKDHTRRLMGKMIQEIPELASFNKKDANRWKEFLTQQMDNNRQVYAREDQNHPRTVCFIGTVNDEMFLKDTTGNRRFWILRVGKINTVELEAVRGQLLAEAHYYLNKGELPILNEQEEALAAEICSQHMQLSTSAEPIMDFVQKLNKDIITYDDLSPIIQACNLNRFGNTAEIKAAMAHIGYVFKQVKIAGKPIRAFKRETQELEPVNGPKTTAIPEPKPQAAEEPMTVEEANSPYVPSDSLEDNEDYGTFPDVTDDPDFNLEAAE